MTNQANMLLDIATRDVVCLPVESTLGAAAEIMAQRRYSSIVVTDVSGHPLGIVTERNILHAMRSGSPPETSVRSSMSAPVVTVPASAHCLDAYQTCLHEGIRHLVLVDDKGVVAGVVSETDFRQHLNLTALAGRRQVITVAKRTVTSLPPHSSLLQALNLMQAQRESCVIVVVDEKPVGIVTERDVVRFYSRDPLRVGVHLAEVMTAPVLTITGEATINDAANLMLERKVRHLAVVDGAGKLAGLVSEHDLTQTMALGMQDERFEVDEIFLRTFIDTIPDLVWLKDGDGVYLACNRRFGSFFGAEEKDIVGKTDYDFVDRDKADFFREHDRKAMAAGKPSVNEEWLTFAADGYRGLFETLKTPMRDGQGRLIGVLGVARDITEHEHVKSALAESEREFRMLAESMPDSLIRYDREGRARYVNPALARNVAALAQPILGEKPAESFQDVPQAVAYQQVLEAVIANGETAELEMTVPHPDGEMHLHHIVFVAARDLGGDIVGALAIGRDITERERIRRGLASSAQEFRALAENLPDNIIRYDRDCRVHYMNPAMLRSIAAELLPTIGKTPIEGTPDSAQIRDLQRLVERVMDSGESVELELEMLHPDGGLHAHHLVFVAERDEQGVVIGALGIGRDITDRKRADEALHRSLDEYSGLVQTIPVGVYKYCMCADGRTIFEFVSSRWCELLDVSEAEVMRDHRAALAHIHPDEQERFVQMNEASRRILSRFEWEGRIVRKNGEVRWLHIESQPTLQENGDILWDGIQYDITDRHRAEETLRINASVFDTSQEAIVITDANNNIIDVNHAFSRITGYAREEVLGKDPGLLNSGRQDKAFYAAMWAALQEEKVWRGEIWNRRKNGEIYAELLSISAICDAVGRVQRHVGVFSDITDFKDHEAELSRVANFDALTGVPNRRLLADRLGQAILHAQRSGKMLAVCYIDLDGFKEVNDRFGHEVGDQLLVDITRRLQEVLRAGDTLARLGGDEFVLLFNDLEETNECFQILDRVMETIATPMRSGSQQVGVSASIGVTFYPADDEDGDTLMRHADQAMYIAKQTGKNHYHQYDSAHDQRMRSLHESRRRILLGLQQEEFELYYQPKMELASGRIAGVEALIRWNHPEQGLLPPADFLPVIENSDFEIALGNWVIDTALAQLHAWEREGVALEVSINISARHLQAFDFVEELERRLDQYPSLPPGRLQIEVLETAALEDMVQSAAIIDACRKLGVSFALDDFGTGYSSLLYLSKLGAETLKIDQSFVRGMLSDEGDHAIVKGVIALAGTFGRLTVAEGVEDKNLLQPLREMGCHYGQGYCIAYPMPAGEFFDWYKKR
ncbi:MAG: PAS domain S-box protein [Sideroxyarcus sp.]|nr:PAS domain S-box protein [Sideroxyarcus sp.]